MQPSNRSRSWSQNLSSSSCTCPHPAGRLAEQDHERLDDVEDTVGRVVVALDLGDELPVHVDDHARQLLDRRQPIQDRLGRVDLRHRGKTARDGCIYSDFTPHFSTNGII